MNDDLDLDWYTYLTEDFKLDKKLYKTADKAVFDCPKCGNTDSVRVAHVKAKIKKIGKYECSTCRRDTSKARAAFKEKHGVCNPGQLDHVNNCKTIDGKRECTKCLRMYATTEFYKKGKYHNSKCKKCQLDYNRKYALKYNKRRRN